MKWLTRPGDFIAIPFFSLFLAALARQHRLHLPQLQFRGGSSTWYTQQHPHPAQLALPPGPEAEAIVREEDFFHLPLQALKVGVADSLAHQEALAKGAAFEPPDLVPDFLKQSRASFFFGEANGTAFATLRSLWGISNADFWASFNSGFTIFTSNSRSRQFFCCTRDNRYMIKTMSGEEIRALDAIIGDYVRHMSTNRRSLIVQYCGHYYVRLYRAPGEPPEDVHFLVMRNLLREPRPGVTVEERYDVKGSTVGRAASAAEKMRPLKEQILKDLDLLRRPLPIEFGEHKGPFLDQVSRDIEFLRAIGVMDYSLLVGICRLAPPPPPTNRAHHLSQRVMSCLLGPPHDPLYDLTTGHHQAGGVALSGGWMIPNAKRGEAYLCGIIDILQQYNKRKRAETLIKSVVHSRDKISAVDPLAYARRFVEFLDRTIEGPQIYGTATNGHHQVPPAPSQGQNLAVPLQYNHHPQHYRFWGRRDDAHPPPPPAVHPSAAPA